MSEQGRKTRLIYNEDADTLGGYRRNFHPAPMSLDEYLRELFEPLIDTHVDTYVWCCGSVAGLHYDSKVGRCSLERFDNPETTFDNTHAWRRWTNLKTYMETGHSPVTVVGENARELGLETFVSLRMNDCHDAYQPDVYTGSIKKEHPEWLIGEPGREYEKNSIPWWMRKAFNYAVDELRRFVVDLVEELLDFDYDGVELDFLSHPFLFRLGEEQSAAPEVTEMLGKIKRMACERGKRLMVRVPATVERCLRIGYDVPAWIEAGVVDMLSLGRNVTPAVTPTGDWVRLVDGTDVTIYPAINTNVTPKHVTADALRAFGMQHLSEGAHGVYLFNFFEQPWIKHHKVFHGAEYGWDALRELGSIDALARRNKLYLVDALEKHIPGAYGHAIPEDLVDLPMELSRAGESGRVLFRIGDRLDDDAPREVFLRLEMINLTEADELRLLLNGRRLIGETRVYPYTTGVDVAFHASPSVLRRGENELDIGISKRNKRIGLNIIVEHVEISIRYV